MNPILSKYNIELEYFNCHARAEFIRIYLHDHGVPFTDLRRTRPEWHTIKSDPEKFTPERYPFGQMPVLRLLSKDTGKVEETISGSLVILGFFQGPPDRGFKSGMIIDGANTMEEQVWDSTWNPDWDSSEEIAKLAKMVQRFLGYIERLLDGSYEPLLWDGKNLTAAGAITLQALVTAAFFMKDGETYPPILDAFYKKVKASSKAWPYLTSEDHSEQRLCMSEYATIDRLHTRIL
ncbi:hypothetical protein BZG36_05375 [Bifiguratus adelaidae]|uniref:GST N-terminal domain-containing protein n=1 Tax=Bifiguratus adelaidae TaxID=1938954 RepID=A0A261XUL0_9FUNG|nr:hypothetical protein BZG36_05375 [Bifiguratus adelaidae]